MHGQGLDELTSPAPTQVVALHDGALREFTVAPEDAGLPRAPVAAIAGGEPAENAAALHRAAARRTRRLPRQRLLNAAAALVVAGRATTCGDGVALAARGHRQRRRLRRAGPPAGRHSRLALIA